MGTFENKDNTIRWAKDKRIMHLCHICQIKYIDIYIEICEDCDKKKRQKELDKVLNEINDKEAKLRQREENLKDKIVWPTAITETNIPAVQDNFCPNCKSEYNINQRFCIKCGFELF